MISFRSADLANESERNFICNSWVRSFERSDTAGMICPARWFETMIPEVVRVLSWPEVRTIVADDPEGGVGLADLQGFIAFDADESPPMVFYVYVKETQRRAGIARALFAAAGIDPARPFLHACTTRAVAMLRREGKISMAKWEPAIGRFHKHDARKPRRGR